MKYRFRDVLTILGILMTAFALPAHSQVTVYNSRASFEAHFSNLEKATFEGVNSSTPGWTGSDFVLNGTAYLFDSTSGYQESGIQFIGDNIGFGPTFAAVADPNYHTPYYNFNGTNTLQGPEAGTLHVTFPGFVGGVYGIGLDLGNYRTDALGVGGGAVTLDFSTGDSYIFSAPTGVNLGFIGFISPAPITELDFVSSGKSNWPEMDNFTVGNDAVTPEPASLLLFMAGGGALLMPALRRLSLRTS